MSRLAGAFGLWAVSGAAGLGLLAGQQPTFRSAVDVVLVEVQVVDQAGRPARGISPDRFQVTIDGRRRRVLSADLMEYAGAADAAVRPARAAAARNFWPTEPGAVGRTFIIAIDGGSLGMGDAALAVRTARAFVDKLGTDDAIGLLTLPRGVALRPTVDRAALAQAFGKVVGTENLRANPFHLSASEIVDINAEIDQMNANALTTVTARGRAQTAIVQDVLRQVQTRECRGTADQVCLQEIVIDAEAQQRDLEDRVTESLNGFKSLLAMLADYPGRKTVVVLSAGMPVSDRTGGWHRDGSQARALGQAAAVANATVYAVHLDAGYRAVYSAENRLTRPSVNLARERELQQRLLADFAFASGGTLFEAPTDTGDRALARVLNETTAFYALGVAPEARDLDGRVHELRVNVTEPDVTVRARRFVVLRKQ